MCIYFQWPNKANWPRRDGKDIVKRKMEYRYVKCENKFLASFACLSPLPLDTFHLTKLFSLKIQKLFVPNGNKAILQLGGGGNESCINRKRKRGVSVKVVCFFFLENFQFISTFHLNFNQLNLKCWQSAADFPLPKIIIRPQICFRDRCMHI